MQWNDVIEKIIEDNGGIAPLKTIYKNAHIYKAIPKGEWQKTLRGILYRDVIKGRFIKVGLGVFSLPNRLGNNTAYQVAQSKVGSEKFLQECQDKHSMIEGMILELGNYFEFLTYTSDINKQFDGKRLNELAMIDEFPNFTYENLIKIIKKCDVIWFKKSKTPLPKFIFEVEASTDFTNSLLKMYQFIDFDTRFLVVAPEEKRTVFNDRISRNPFESMNKKFEFKSFEQVVKLYFSAVEHYELKEKFLN